VPRKADNDDNPLEVITTIGPPAQPTKPARPAANPPCCLSPKDRLENSGHEDSPLKFEYNVTSSNVQIAQFHGRVIKAMIEAYGDDITVNEKDGDKAIMMATFPPRKAL
jgi:hypothetical protein